MAEIRQNAGQLVLSLPRRTPRFDRASFLVSSSNEAGVRTAEAWLESNEPALIICGPKGAGKTHLAHVIANAAHGRVVTASDLADEDYPVGTELSKRPSLVVLDDFPGGVPPKILLANINSMSEHGVRLVLTGEANPGDWAGGLSDLMTRLEAMVRASLDEPDEALMHKVIFKQFRDRQVEVSGAVVDFAVSRLPRTFAAASAFVALSDEAALAANQKITVPLVQNIVDNLSEGTPDA